MTFLKPRSLLAAAILAAIVAVACTFDIVRVSSGSMRPSIRNGDYILVLSPRGVIRQLLPLRRFVRRNSIVVFALEEQQGAPVLYVKRVAAKAADRVRIAEGSLILNGLHASDPHAFYETRAARRRDSWPAGEAERRDIAVPPGNVFVLGDNRSGSTDSRTFGPVAGSSIVGVAVLVLRLPHAGFHF